MVETEKVFCPVCGEKIPLLKLLFKQYIRCQSCNHDIGAGKRVTITLTGILFISQIHIIILFALIPNSIIHIKTGILLSYLIFIMLTYLVILQEVGLVDVSDYKQEIEKKREEAKSTLLPIVFIILGGLLLIVILITIALIRMKTGP